MNNSSLSGSNKIRLNSLKDLGQPSIIDNENYILKSYAGRTFVEKDVFPTIYRNIVHENLPLWVYTVDIAKEIDDLDMDTGKKFVRIIRWAARNDPDDKNIKYWIQFKWYNIRSKIEWQRTSSIVNTLYGTAKKIKLPPTFINLEQDLLNKKNEDIDQLIHEIQGLKNRQSIIMAENAAFRSRFGEMKHNIKEYKNFLKSFKELVDDENSTETQVHDLLEEHRAYWLFGLEYIDMLSHESIPINNNKVKGYEFDLLLKRQDSFWDLAELKGPNENLFDQRTTKRFKPNQKLSEALGQVITYLNICDTNLKHIFKPKAIIVIGKKDKDLVKERRLFGSYLNNIEILTYTDLYEKGKALLEYISRVDSGGKKSKKDCH